MPQDVDGTGVVEYSEFLAATIEAHGGISEERLAEAFDRIVRMQGATTTMALCARLTCKCFSRLCVGLR